MDRDEIKDFLALMTRLAVAMEEQAKHQQEWNEMNKQWRKENVEKSEMIDNLHLQWREEDLQREQQQRALQMQREDQWHKNNLDLQERMTREYIKNASININLDRE